MDQLVLMSKLALDPTILQTTGAAQRKLLRWSDPTTIYDYKLTWSGVFVRAHGWTGLCALSATNAFSSGGPATVTIVS
jgi:hypothetical protein